MIEAQFGQPGISLRTLELYLDYIGRWKFYRHERYTTATLKATLQPPLPPKPKWAEIMDCLSDVACKTYEYRKGIKKASNKRNRYRNVVLDKKFVPYFRSSTPINELSNLNIGSRPSKRKTDGGIETLRAIPWIFSFTQVFPLIVLFLLCF